MFTFFYLSLALPSMFSFAGIKTSCNFSTFLNNNKLSEVRTNLFVLRVYCYFVGHVCTLFSVL